MQSFIVIIFDALSHPLQGLGESKVSVVDTATDARQLLRHLGDLPLKLPLWRQQRPSLLVETARFEASAESSEAGTLILRWVFPAYNLVLAATPLEYAVGRLMPYRRSQSPGKRYVIRG